MNVALHHKLYAHYYVRRRQLKLYSLIRFLVQSYVISMVGPIWNM